MQHFPAAQNCSNFEPFARASAFVAQLQAELAEVVRCQAIMAGIIGEMAS
jgi:hypothetical protein